MDEGRVVGKINLLDLIGNGNPFTFNLSSLISTNPEKTGNATDLKHLLVSGYHLNNSRRKTSLGCQLRLALLLRVDGFSHFLEATMDQLIEQVTQKTGIPADKARTAVETVINFLKSKLPESIGGQLDQLVSGEGAPNLGDAAKNLGGIFGKKS